jgi:hypothetical protein
MAEASRPPPAAPDNSTRRGEPGQGLGRPGPGWRERESYSFHSAKEKPFKVHITGIPEEVLMLPDVVEIRTKLKGLQDRLEVLRGHL